MLTTIDENILDFNNLLSVAQKCTDVFIDSYTLDRDLSSSSSLRGYWGAGEYSIDKVRAFYSAKESKFRKNLKKADKNLNVKIWKDFGGNVSDNIWYNFYYKNQLLFRLILTFTNKAIQYGTYKELTYEVRTDNELIKEHLKKPKTTWQS